MCGCGEGDAELLISLENVVGEEHCWRDAHESRATSVPGIDHPDDDLELDHASEEALLYCAGVEGLAPIGDRGLKRKYPDGPSSGGADHGVVRRPRGGIAHEHDDSLETRGGYAYLPGDDGYGYGLDESENDREEYPGDMEIDMGEEGYTEDGKTKPACAGDFWSTEAARDLRDASELTSEELSETVAAIEYLSTQQSGVQCIAHHPHSSRLLQALVLALAGATKVALDGALQGHCMQAAAGAHLPAGDIGSEEGGCTAAKSPGAGQKGNEYTEKQDTSCQVEGQAQDPFATITTAVSDVSNAAKRERELEGVSDRDRHTCFAAVNALCNISGCTAGRKWLASQPAECEHVVGSLCVLMHDQLAGWEVTDVAAASTLGLSNLLCSKVISAKCIEAEISSVSMWAAVAGPGASAAGFSVISAETGCTTETSRGSGTLVRGLLRQLSHFPSHGAVSSATAIGNLARREGGIDILLASKDDALAMIEDLADMVDDAIEDARAEALTALCNLLEDERALQLLLRSEQALHDIVSGVASCLAPYRIREAMECADMEAVSDAAALIGRVLSHARGEHAVVMHDQAAAVAQGLAAMAHPSADKEASLVAMEALCAMLDGVPTRPMLVSSIPAGALLFRLNSWLSDGFQGDSSPEPDEQQPFEHAIRHVCVKGKATKVVEKVLLKLLDGLGRGEDGGVWQHVDSKRVVLGVTQLVLDAATRIVDESERLERARQAALMSGGKFRAPTGGGTQRDAALSLVAAKSAESLGRFAMSLRGARAICAQADIVKIVKSLLLISCASRTASATRGSRLAIHMLLSHVDICRELAERALKPPPPTAPARAYTVEEGKELVDDLLGQLVAHLSADGGEDDDDPGGFANVEDCVGAVAGLAQCEPILRHLETNTRLPLLLLKLVVVLASAHGDQTDASVALTGLLAFSARARDALHHVIQYLKHRMLGLPNPVSVLSNEHAPCVRRDASLRTSQCSLSAEGEGADLYSQDAWRIGVAELERGLMSWQGLTAADSCVIIGTCAHTHKCQCTCTHEHAHTHVHAHTHAQTHVLLAHGQWRRFTRRN